MSRLHHPLPGCLYTFLTGPVVLPWRSGQLPAYTFGADQTFSLFNFEYANLRTTVSALHDEVWTSIFGQGEQPNPGISDSVQNTPAALYASQWTDFFPYHIAPCLPFPRHDSIRSFPHNGWWWPSVYHCRRCAERNYTDEVPGFLHRKSSFPPRKIHVLSTKLKAPATTAARAFKGCLY